MKNKATGISPNKSSTKKQASVKRVTKKKSSIKPSTKKQASTRRKRKNIQISSAEANTLTQQTEQLTWIAAIAKVLNDEKQPLHYTEIARLIEEKNYRTDLGATPSNSVNGEINRYINKFIKVKKGTYILKSLIGKTDDESLNSKDLITSYGFYWNRNNIIWKNTPKILGTELNGSGVIDFTHQIGVYLLHDGRETIYIGKAIEQAIGTRLYQHTSDRFAGRWDRFSWLGFLSVNDDGSLKSARNAKQLTMQELGNLLEAVLIECIEPRLNRRKGDNNDAIEYLQHVDPDLKILRIKESVDELKNK